MSDIMRAVKENRASDLRTLLNQHSGQLDNYRSEDEGWWYDYFTALHYAVYNHCEKNIDSREVLRLLAHK